MTLEDVVASSNRSIEKSSIANFSRQRFLHLSSLEKGNSSIFRRFVDESTPEFSTTALSNFFLSHSLSRSHSFHIRNFSRTHAQIYLYTRKVSLSLSLSLLFCACLFNVSVSLFFSPRYPLLFSTPQMRERPKNSKSKPYGKKKKNAHPRSRKLETIARQIQ